MLASYKIARKDLSLAEGFENYQAFWTLQEGLNLLSPGSTFPAGII